MVKSLVLLITLCLLLPTAFPATMAKISYASTANNASSIMPIRFTYINRLTSWWGAQTVPAALGVPGFTSSPLPFNYIALTFWTYRSGALDAANMWANIGANMGANSFGTTTQQIQATLKGYYKQAGIKLLVSAFGATENPTTAGVDPTDCGLKLAKFVKDNQLDGVDIDWEDTGAFQRGDGSGENWLITLTKVLKANLPADAIITHAPQAPYFAGTTFYPKGGYLAVEKAVGNLIKFYNVQFYNQGSTTYDTAQGLFNSSGGWCPGSSVNEIITAGVPGSKIVIGKPASTIDANNGWMSAADLNAAIAKNYAYNGWKTGLMFWQFTSDITGSFMNAAGKGYITQTETILN